MITVHYFGSSFAYFCEWESPESNHGLCNKVHIQLTFKGITPMMAVNQTYCVYWGYMISATSDLPFPVKNNWMVYVRSLKSRYILLRWSMCRLF